MNVRSSSLPGPALRISTPPQPPLTPTFRLLQFALRPSPPTARAARPRRSLAARAADDKKGLDFTSNSRSVRRAHRRWRNADRRRRAAAPRPPAAPGTPPCPSLRWGDYRVAPGAAAAPHAARRRARGPRQRRANRGARRRHHAAPATAHPAPRPTRQGLGYTNEDSAGQSNIFAVEPKAYVAGSARDSTAGSAFTSVYAVTAAVVGGAAIAAGISLAPRGEAPLVAPAGAATVSEYVRAFSAQPAPVAAPVAAAPALVE